MWTTSKKSRSVGYLSARAACQKINVHTNGIRMNLNALYTHTHSTHNMYLIGNVRAGHSYHILLLHAFPISPEVHRHLV